MLYLKRVVQTQSRASFDNQANRIPTPKSDSQSHGTSPSSNTAPLQRDEAGDMSYVEVFMGQGYAKRVKTNGSKSDDRGMTIAFANTPTGVEVSTPEPRTLSSISNAGEVLFQTLGAMNRSWTKTRQRCGTSTLPA